MLSAILNQEAAQSEIKEETATTRKWEEQGSTWETRARRLESSRPPAAALRR